MLASAVRDIIAPVIRECPTDCGIVSITRVDVSSDTSYATVYISALKEVEEALKFLESQIPRLRTMLGALNRRKIPIVRFRIDHDSEKSSRLDAILNS